MRNEKWLQMKRYLTQENQQGSVPATFKRNLISGCCIRGLSFATRTRMLQWKMEKNREARVDAFKIFYNIFTKKTRLDTIAIVLKPKTHANSAKNTGIIFKNTFLLSSHQSI